MESQSQHLEQIQQRLLQLERQNRRFKQVGAIVLIVMAALFVMGQAAPGRKTVEAQEFILKDASGKVRATLSMIVPKGAAPGAAADARLVMFDEKGTERATLQSGTLFGITGLLLRDGQGHDRASLTQTDTFSLGSMFLLEDEKRQVNTRIKEGEVLSLGEVSSLKVNSDEFNLNSTGGS